MFTVALAGLIVFSTTHDGIVRSAFANLERTTPWALGSLANVRGAEQAAKRCGIKHTFVRTYPNGRAVLFSKGGNTPQAVKCTNRWLALRERAFDPLLGAE